MIWITFISFIYYWCRGGMRTHYLITLHNETLSLIFTVKKGNWQGRLHSYSLVHYVRTGKQFVASGFSSSKPYVTPMLLDEVDFGSLLRSVDVINEGPRGVPRHLGTDFSG